MKPFALTFIVVCAGTVLMVLLCVLASCYAQAMDRIDAMRERRAARRARREELRQIVHR
ncbi:MAG TPA: hypothetical protein PLF88_04250 [Opitutaceae bacterium]|nr:hypothetical protein [Opitutaceae bacterium]HRJ47457.1 hypothetical protein [Opitutaceae bacterium]